MRTDTLKKYLRRLGIDRRPYMFYPAHFWPHKNHRMLLVAYRMLLSKQTELPFDLVFAGSIYEPMLQLKQEAKLMGLDKNVHFIGCLPAKDLARVYHGCDVLIFPSRYENNGLTLSYALAFNKPILCSNIKKYRRTARKSATFFDPRKPDDIIRCIQQVWESVKSIENRKGNNNKDFSNTTFINKKLNIVPFLGAINTSNNLKNKMIGRFKDGWTAEELIITYAKGPIDRVLEIRLEAPLWLPHDCITLEIWEADCSVGTYKMFRENELTIRHSLSSGGGVVNILIYPCFQPLEMFMEPDTRILGILCHKAWIISHDNKKSSLIKNR